MGSATSQGVPVGGGDTGPSAPAEGHTQSGKSHPNAFQSQTEILTWTVGPETGARMRAAGAVNLPQAHAHWQGLHSPLCKPPARGTLLPWPED